MKIKILGSGGWEGIPSPFCTCVVCQKATDDPTSKDNRTRPEILVEGEGGNFLIELSPDIRLQSTKFKLPLIKDFLISHWHFDHLYGIMELHAWSEFVMKGDINVFCSPKTRERIEETFEHIPKNVIPVQAYESFNLYGITITPIPLYHMRGSDNNVQENDLNNVFGYTFEKDGKKIVYLADYYKIALKTVELIKGADVIIADGTYLFENMFPNKEAQNGLKTDGDHLHGEDILSCMQGLNPARVVFHSITHLSEKNHDELQALLPHNYKLSYDGMDVTS